MGDAASHGGQCGREAPNEGRRIRRPKRGRRRFGWWHGDVGGEAQGSGGSLRKEQDWVEFQTDHFVVTESGGLSKTTTG